MHSVGPIIRCQHHEKAVLEKKKVIKELKRTIRDREEENGRLSDDLQDLNVSVNERRHINEVNGMLLFVT